MAVYPYYRILLSNKKEKLTTHSITWMNFKIIMPNEISHTQKNANYMILFIQNSL